MSNVGKVLFLARNRIDEATVSASTAATPASRVQNPRPTRKWFGTGKASEYLQADFGREVLIQHIAFVGHNLDTQGTLSGLLANTADFASPLVNSGDLYAWLEVFGLGDDPLGETLGGLPILDSFNDYRPIRFMDLGQIYSARYARSFLKNSTNSLITQAGLGWWYAGVGFQPDWPFDFGWGWAWRDPSETIETESSSFVRSRKSRRNLRLTLRDLTEVEAIGHVDVIMRAIGKKKPMLVVPFPAGDAPLQYATNLYGFMPNDPEITQTGVDQYEITFTIEELPS